MKVLIITGGIATGKSAFLRSLRRFAGSRLEFIDCDAIVGKLLDGGEVRDALVEAFGNESVQEHGMADRAWLRRHIFAGQDAKESKQRLEAILHPIVLQDCLNQIAKARAKGSVLGVVVDVPLWYEAQFPLPNDGVCVVAASPEIQRQRLNARAGQKAEEIAPIMDAQLPLEEKVARADHVIWNNGTFDMLKHQAALLFKQFFVPSEYEPPTREIDAPPDFVAIEYNVNDLRGLPMTELRTMAQEAELLNAHTLTKDRLVLELVRKYLKAGHRAIVSGVLEQAKDNYAMLRNPKKSFKTSIDDIYIGGDVISKHKIRPGHLVTVDLRPLRHHDKFLSTGKVLAVEGVPIEEFSAGTKFEKLTPLFPRERIILENKDLNDAAMRVIDIIAPLGKGQRGLIVAPPRGGKTIILKSMARAIHANNPETKLIVLLLDERPEEVTDFEEAVDADIFASTFDEPARRHAQVSDLVIERAKRLVEQGKDVVILLDSLTRLARGHNANQVGGRIMSGGLGAKAMETPRRFFSAARNVEEGGSLTIVATCLVETESRMDEVIFEEFKGTGNLEIKLDREMAERRLFPAISIPQSGTRNDERLYNEAEYQRILQIRKQLSQLPGWDGLELLLKNISKTQNNAELALTGLRTGLQ